MNENGEQKWESEPEREEKETIIKINLNHGKS